MSASQSWWMIWPDNAILSLLVLFVIAIPLLYAARKPAHGLIRTLSHTIAAPLRMGARWLLATAQELKQRNKVVLLARGREEVGQSVEREFERVGALVTRDLHGYPSLQRKLLDEITRVEEDYKKCGEVPPPPPDWVEAVTAVTKVKSSVGNEMVQRILAEINRSINKIHDKALAEYRQAYESRHKILKGFMPFWRSLDKTLSQVDTKLVGLQESAVHVDAQMEKYEQINAKTDKAEQTLASSASIQFVISGLVMLIAFGGAFVNFKLIALPMSAMVGGGDYITANLQAAEVAALVIILFETLMGLFLAEGLRFTHLFPLSNITEKMRKRIVWISFTILLVLAGVEVGLAVMRDLIIHADVALKQALGNTQAAPPVETGWVTKVPTWGQMILGFTLPFALAFVAIPLEYFIHSARSVVGTGLVLVLRAIAFLLRVLGSIVRHAGRMLLMVYDIVIFAPLLVERMVMAARSPSGGRSEVTPFGKRSATGDRTL